MTMMDEKEFQRRRDLIRVGAWFSECCYRCLYRIDTEQEAQELRDSFDVLQDCEEQDLAPQIWATEKEALEHWLGDIPEDDARIRERLKEIE